MTDMSNWREQRDQQRQALHDAGYDGPHHNGMFGQEFAICERCGAMVSLAAREVDGQWIAWAVQAHESWHEERP